MPESDEKINVSPDEFKAAIAVVLAARKALEESAVEGHSVDEDEGQQNFTDINVC